MKLSRSSMKLPLLGFNRNHPLGLRGPLESDLLRSVFEVLTVPISFDSANLAQAIKELVE